jgi:hypothetical protein
MCDELFSKINYRKILVVAGNRAEFDYYCNYMIEDFELYGYE